MKQFLVILSGGETLPFRHSQRERERERKNKEPKTLE